MIETQIETIVVKRYRCPTCRKTWANKSTVREHLSRCIKNPENKACGTCKFNFVGDYRVYDCELGLLPHFPQPGAVAVSTRNLWRLDCPQWELAFWPSTDL